ncbi:hypothetical protein Tco_1300121 [Tanacetum coccineum]
MTSITAQQTKLDLELVPNKNRCVIGKCNGRIPHRLKPKEETFQVVLGALALTPCYPAFLITADVPEICPRVQDREFDPLPSEEDTIPFLRDLNHTRVINSLNDVVSISCINLGELLLLLSTEAYLERLVRNRIGMHTSKDDYLINTLRFVSRKEASQKYGAVLPDCSTSPEMKESKAYKSYLAYVTGAVPPKKGKRVKRAAKKPYTTPAAEAMLKEVQKKSLRDFHRSHPGGSGTTVEKPPSVEKITPTVTCEGTGDKPGVPDVTKDDSTESESESWGNDEDDSNDEDQQSSNEGNEQKNESDEQEYDSKQDEESEDNDQEEEEFDEENESQDDEMKSDEGQGMDDTTDQGEGTNAEMTNAQ